MTDAYATPPAAPKRRHPAEQLGAGKATTDAEGVTIEGAVVDEPYETRGNFDHVLALFNLDPAAFVIVDDTVRMSTWQQSKGLDDGTRDVVQLYAYSLRARRVTADDIRPEVVDTWRAALITEDTAPMRAPYRKGGTYVMLVADPQIGKKGTAEAVENWRRGVREHVAAARELGPDDIVVAFMGDEHENVMGNYRNQPHTIELNRSRQLELDYDLRVWTMREALGLGLPVRGVSVISNHGEWTREGDTKDPMTTRNDNSSTYIARHVEKLFDELAPYTGQTIEWTIGETRPGVVVDLSGVPAYFSHGYVEKGRGPSIEVKTVEAIKRQIVGRTEDLGRVRLFNMAHYHHHYLNTFEGRVLFGCPALEAERSSEYMLDQYGVWSRPGMLGYLAGTHLGPDGYGWVNVY